jgi:ABC-type spermidine/putrescine transport system permease subunit II
MKRTWKVKLWRASIILIVGTYLLLPLYSMLDFSTKPFLFGQKGRTLDAWKVIPSQPDLTIAIFRSVISAIIVMFLILVLIVPTVV